jgi:hypothetical protein
MKRASLAALSVVLVAGCSSEAPPVAAVPAGSGPEFREIADVKQVMDWILDPNADVVWDAVGTIVSAEGTQEVAPETDEQWTAVRNSAAIVAEAGNLLLMPSRARDHEDWAKHAHAMTQAAQEALVAADAKDTEALFTAGGEIYAACSACHAQYMLDSKQPE